SIMRSMARLLTHRHMFKNSQVFYAMNMDSLILALFMRVFCTRVKVVYEVADISPILVRDSLGGTFSRLVEKTLLKFVNTLVVTSPAYVRHYFEPRYSYHGNWFLLENRIYPSPPPQTNPRKLVASCHREPWTIGYFGLF